MPDLPTPRQTEILDFVRQHLRDQGFPPSHSDIGEHFGFGKAAARDHLQALARKGYIEISPADARGIRLLQPTDTAPNACELPLIGRIAAGSPITAEQNVETRVIVDPTLFKPRADFLHRVEGHSMVDVDVRDGDLVGIHAQDTADNGQIIAACVLDRRTSEERITLKRYSRRGHLVVLKSENSAAAYKPIEIDLSRFDPDTQEAPPFRIAGILAGLLRAGSPK